MPFPRLYHKKLQLGQQKRNPIKPHPNAKRQSKLPEAKPTIDELEMQLYEAVRRFLLLSQFFICAPHGVHRSSSNEGCGRWCDRLLLWLHLIWCGALYIAYAVSVYFEYTESNSNLPTVQKPLFFSEYLVYLIHICQIIVSVYVGRKKYHRFIHAVVQFDHALLAFHIQPEYQSLARFLHGHLWLIACHFICTVIVDYYYSDFYFVGFIRSATVYIIPNMILQLSLVQYYALLHVISQRLERLNTVLRAQLSRKLCGKELHKQLHQLRMLYSYLQIFTKQVNDAFGRSVILVYLGSFMNVTLNIFLIYKYVDNLGSARFWWIMYSVVWTCMHIGKMFLILYYNYRVQNQKNTTALVLNGLKGQNAEMEETITHFILQLIINPRTNVACGVMELNMDYITSLLVAISTLFIFLLQYDITLEALTQQRNPVTPNRSTISNRQRRT